MLNAMNSTQKLRIASLRSSIRPVILGYQKCTPPITANTGTVPST